MPKFNYTNLTSLYYIIGYLVRKYQISLSYIFNSIRNQKIPFPIEVFNRPIPALNTEMETIFSHFTSLQPRDKIFFSMALIYTEDNITTPSSLLQRH